MASRTVFLFIVADKTDLSHRRTGRGGPGGGGRGGGCSPPKILGDLDFLGSKRNLGKANYLRCFPAVF